MEKIKMTKTNYTRQLDWYNPETDVNKVLIIGAGSLGSYTAFLLARMGKNNFTLCDPDRVEEHNFPNQFFDAYCKVGMAKTQCVSNTISAFDNSLNIYPINNKIENQIQILSDYTVVIITVDNQQTRKTVFEHLLLNRGRCNLLIDASSAGQYANIKICNLTNSGSILSYKKQLWTEDEASHLPCTGKSICDMSAIIAGWVVNAYRHYTSGDLTWMWIFIDGTNGTSYVMQPAKAPNDNPQKTAPPPSEPDEDGETDDEGER